MLTITFSDEAFEAFERMIDLMPGYTAQLVTEDGKKQDVELHGHEAADGSDVIVVRDFDEHAVTQTSPLRRVSLMDIAEVHIF